MAFRRSPPVAFRLSRWYCAAASIWARGSVKFLPVRPYWWPVRLVICMGPRTPVFETAPGSKFFARSGPDSTSAVARGGPGGGSARAAEEVGAEEETARRREKGVLDGLFRDELAALRHGEDLLVREGAGGDVLPVLRPERLQGRGRGNRAELLPLLHV